MGQYRQMLVLLGEVDPHSAALRRGLALAHVSGASVHVLGLFEPREEPLLREERLNEADIKRQYDHYREQLRVLVERHRGHGVVLTVDSLAVDDIRSDAIDYISELQPDLVIKDSDCASTLARLFGTPLDCALMRGFQGLTLFVPRAAVSLPRRVMVAVDTSFSETPTAQQQFNQGLIRVAQALALQCGAALHLLSAYNLGGVFAADMSVTQAWIEEMRQALQEPFNALAEAEGVAHDCRHFMQGGPVQVICEQVAALEVDAVVMGVVQPKGMDKLLGDTTERIVGHPPCSVLAVHPHVFEPLEPWPCN
ncbi:universal stress protein [Pseudomonas soli]|jgi:universal stress protein E|uniref:Universal stress protein n=1 Tax=Pseudomonas soli TaxID=1306993 RepID=A0A1H9L7J5_9PSED|nr:universal stress protein [Pseudomonas soli]MDT3715097.1 universal stress protein [Pseudomonas soli]MDT3731510.1 universal stress protein [Pseudomonas soli]MEE1879722.1 universal stress protein [Pseudomonas soli]NBK42109.1 universal stress protein [Pseudomonas soli]WJO20072.1 universal stress protein [Pseudomonas soli]